MWMTKKEYEEGRIIAENDGVINYHPTSVNIGTGTLERKGALRKEYVVVSDQLEVTVDDTRHTWDLELERHKVPYGASMWYKPGERVEKGQIVAVWEPLCEYKIAEHAGLAHLIDLYEGETIITDRDEVTNLGTIMVLHRNEWPIGRNLMPRIEVGDHTYHLCGGEWIFLTEGSELYVGDVVYRRPWADKFDRCLADARAKAQTQT